MVAERRGGLRTWSAALVICTFVLTLFGTFLTRSGVVASVHSFTQSAIGPWYLAGILVALAGASALLVARLPDLRDRETPTRIVSRESAFLFNNVLFLVITAVVIFGTLLPLGVEALGGGTIGVGAPWFNRVNVPLFVALLFLMGVGPALPWGGASPVTLRDRFGLPLLAAALAMLAAYALGMREIAPLATLGMALFTGGIMLDELLRGTRARMRGRGEPASVAGWRLATRNRRRYGGYVVHAGILVMGIAIAVSATLSSDASATLAPGESISVAGHTVTYDRLVVEPLADDPRVIETRAEIHAGDTSLATALRDYPNSETPIATPVVRTSLGEDLYVTLMAADPATDSVTLRVFVNPLVAWIWLGGGIVLAGAIFAIWPDARPLRVARPASTPATADTTLSALEQEAG
jgi:cytochrome c-type biogenesis protein CcmF